MDTKLVGALVHLPDRHSQVLLSISPTVTVNTLAVLPFEMGEGASTVVAAAVALHGGAQATPLISAGGERKRRQLHRLLPGRRDGQEQQQRLLCPLKEEDGVRHVAPHFE